MQLKMCTSKLTFAISFIKKKQCILNYLYLIVSSLSGYVWVTQRRLESININS